MANTNINARVIHKHGTQVNWEKITDFIPMKGEIVIYDTDETYAYERIKIGDGVTEVNQLPFNIDTITDTEIDEVCGATIQSAEEVMV